MRAACAHAETRGALRFDATVQSRNEPMFARARLGRGCGDVTVARRAARARCAGRSTASQRLVAAHQVVLARALAPLASGRWRSAARVRRRRRRAGAGHATWSPPATRSCPSMVERDPEWAGWCAVLVNVNDLAAMGADPVGLLDAVGARDALDSPTG